MVYGVLRFINFAHGDVYMLGAFAGSISAPKLLSVFGGSPSSRRRDGSPARRDGHLRRRSASSSSGSATGRCATARS